MIAFALLVAAAAASGAIDAERAFASKAQTEGQWTAFRAFAAPDALMFGPEPTNAHTLLKDAKNPPVAVMWWPRRSWVSCDAQLAVNTGPWVRSGGKNSGTFTTVWQRQSDGGWKWLLDHGRDTPRLVSAGDQPRIVQPTCRNLAAAAKAKSSDAPARELVVQLPDRMPSSDLPSLAGEQGSVIGGGASPDNSLRWEARAVSGEPGAHVFRVWTWDGSSHRLALFEATGASLQ
jgi:hypothetical protein